MKRDLLNTRTPEQDKKMKMAENVANLKSKQSKQQQVSMLCKSLVSMIRGK